MNEDWCSSVLITAVSSCQCWSRVSSFHLRVACSFLLWEAKATLEHSKMLGKWPDTFYCWRKELRAGKKANVSIETALQIILISCMLRRSGYLSSFGVPRINISWWWQWFGVLATVWCFTSDRHSSYHQTWLVSWLLMIISAMGVLRIASFSKWYCLMHLVQDFNLHENRLIFSNSVYWLFFPYHDIFCSQLIKH